MSEFCSIHELSYGFWIRVWAHAHFKQNTGAGRIAEAVHFLGTGLLLARLYPGTGLLLNQRNLGQRCFWLGPAQDSSVLLSRNSSNIKSLRSLIVTFDLSSILLFAPFWQFVRNPFNKRTVSNLNLWLKLVLKEIDARHRYIGQNSLKVVAFTQRS